MPVYPSAFTDQQIADQLTRDGLHWATTSLTYSFNDYSTSGNTLDATHIAWLEKAVSLFEEFFGLSFTLVGSGGDITFNGTSGFGTFASQSWFVPSLDLSNVDIEFDQSWDTNQSASLSYGSYGFTTIMHEFLHALGLAHPGDYNAGGGPISYFVDAELLQDTARYSIMSYFYADEDGSFTSHWFDTGTDFEWRFAQTPMIYDLLAMSEGSFDGKFGGYSLNATTRSGNTSYGYNATVGINEVYNFAVNEGPILTILDASGVDTLDLSGDIIDGRMIISYDSNGISSATEGTRTTTVIDLREGHYSSTHGMTNNIGIAFGTVIENAVGTQFADTIEGNDAGNNLQGNSGADTLYGGLGNDTLDGGADADTANGGDGNDTIRGGAGNDTLDGGIGLDDMSGGVGLDTMTGGDDVDTLRGQGDADTLNGSGGADKLYGGSGNDTLNGGDGDDLLEGQGNNDTLSGNADNDTLRGAAGSDTLIGGAGNDNLNGGAGADRLDGGTGNDFMTGTADGNRDTFVFTQGYGLDRANSFEQGVDRLELNDVLWLAGHGTLNGQQVVDNFATLNGAGNILTFDFGGGDLLEVQRSAGFVLATLGADIFIV